LLARIDVEVHRDLDGLVEFRGGARFDLLDRVVDLQRRRVRGNPVIRLGQPFADLCHVFFSRVVIRGLDPGLHVYGPVKPGHDETIYSTTWRPSERAEPITIRHAASRSLALRSTIFSCAISRIWPIVTRPTVPPLPVVCEPFSIPAAFFRK